MDRTGKDDEGLDYRSEGSYGLIVTTILIMNLVSKVIATAKGHDDISGDECFRYFKRNILVMQTNKNLTEKAIVEVLRMSGGNPPPNF